MFRCLDLLSMSTWKNRETENPHGQSLAAALPQITLASLAPNTVEKYTTYWLPWKDWELRYYGANTFPVEPFRLALYLVELQQQSKSIAPIDAVIYALRWMHTIADVPSPTEHQFFVSTWHGCKRLLACPIQPTDPIEVSALHRLAADLESPTLMESRLLVLCLLCYSGALRIQEVLQIRVKDIVFSETSMRLFIPKRKNDQYRDGHHVTIARTRNITCPYTATKCLISAGKLGPDFPLIGRIVHTKNGQLCKPTSISYSRACDILRDGLSKYLFQVSRGS